MKLIKPSFEIWQQPSGLEGVYKQIEHVGRVCYKSEDKITEDSAKPFVDRMIKSGHGAMLEHGTVYLKVTYKDTDFVTLSMFYGHNKYSKVTHSEDNKVYYITTNYRELVENNHLGDLKYLCEPTEFHEKRVCVHFILDRAIAMEFIRHRTFSFSMESTRYCNYSRDKFSNEVTFIEPCWLEDYNYEGNTYYNGFLTALRAAEDNYLDLLKQWEDKIPDKRYKTGFRNNPWTPQQARAVLPNALKTELVMTGFVDDWQHFFRLRSRIAETGKPHPQAQELADPLMNEFIARKYILLNLFKMKTGIKVGDVLSETSHYVVAGFNFDGSIRCKHFESGEEVNIGKSYVDNYIKSGDNYDQEVRVTKEDKKDGTLGIRTIFENIHSGQVFTVCFKKQDKPRSKKAINADIEKKVELFTAAIERAKAQKKSISEVAKKHFSDLMLNPILGYEEGEERVLRGYKIQFASRDDRYDCVDMDIVKTDKESGIRPVNINTIRWLVYNGVKYIVE